MNIFSKIVSLLLFVFCLLFFVQPALAIVDPLASLNNKHGIHIISAISQEASETAQLVNSSGGDWGYITVLIESKDRNNDKWQAFFNELRRKHLIPLVRIATQPERGFWKYPYEGEEIAWADFLDNLVWPTKNRYIIIYNEPNQGQEWAGKVNPSSYAEVLNKTIDALKNKNPDFFVLNAGFDASAPNIAPLYQDEATFLQDMDKKIPGIFNKLDGWVSHSYPNPGFISSPSNQGKGSVRTFEWELAILKKLGVEKNLPVFITETGWKHAEGINYDKSLPTSETIGKYYIEAYQNAWSNPNIVAVTPFLLNYQEDLFDHFSFKRLAGPLQNKLILEEMFPQYYSHYQVLVDLPKVSGKPFQDNTALLIKGEIYNTIVSGENYEIPLTFKNTGQSIWNDDEIVELRALMGSQELGIKNIKLVTDQKVEPGQEITFTIHLQVPKSGTYKISLQLFHGKKAFDGYPFEFTTQVKPPVILKINSSLLWKKNSSGEYLLNIDSELGKYTVPISLNEKGVSQSIEERFLIPNKKYTFIINKFFYQSKSIDYTVTSGINNLDFGTLNPNFLSALLKPKIFWSLLPFSN